MSKEITLDEIQSFEGKYPKQLWFLFASEMWERFCFYGMRGVLTIFMVEQLGFLKPDANLKYGAIQAFVYTMTFVGGMFADKILGFRKSIFWGGLLMIIGSLTIAFSPENLFFIGTSISIVGTGFFKPNISGVVGMLYKDGDGRRDAGFSLFYSGINIGALFGGYLCFYLGDNYGWEYAFYSTAIAMTLGLIIFSAGQKNLGPLGFSPLMKNEGMTASKANMYQLLVFIGSLACIPLIILLISNSAYTNMFMLIVGPAALVYFLFEMFRSTAEERSKLFAALIFIIFSIFFWAFFEQSGGSLALVARDHTSGTELMGFPIDPNEVNNAANSLFVIVFSPLLGLLWLWMNKRKAEPNTVIKFGLGFIFLAGAFYVFHTLILYAGSDGISSLGVFTFAYLVITFGELCLSPIGLSAMTKLAPRRMFGIIMGMWFLASAYGQFFAGILGAGMASTGEYEIVIGKNPDEKGAVLITWEDKAEIKGDFEKMEIILIGEKGKESKSKWEALVGEEGYFVKKEKDVIVALMVTGIKNDGKEAIVIPQNIIDDMEKDKDLKPIVQPVPVERLKCYTDGYLQLTIYAIVCGVVLILISPLVRKLMGEVK